MRTENAHIPLASSFSQQLLQYAYKKKLKQTEQKLKEGKTHRKKSHHHPISRKQFKDN